MILVTGGNGYVGSALCRQLVDSGHEVCSVSRRQYDTKGYLSLVGDVSDKASLEAIFDQYPIETVVHLASMLNTASVQNPDRAVRVNVVGSLNLMEVCRERRTRRFIFGSSFNVLGPRPGRMEACDETEPALPGEFYGETKRFVEQLGISLANLGANALMVNYVQVGLDAARMVCEDRRVAVPVLGHNSGATSLYANPNSGLSATLINAKLPRLCGLDICIFLTDLGKFPMLRECGILIVREMLSPLYDVRPTLPVAAGGVTPGRIDVICSQYGHDIAIGAGGTVFGHPYGPRAGARAFRQAIDAAMEARDIADAAQEHPELGVAVKLWDPAKAAQ